VSRYNDNSPVPKLWKLSDVPGTFSLGLADVKTFKPDTSWTRVERLDDRFIHLRSLCDSLLQMLPTHSTTWRKDKPTKNGYSNGAFSPFPPNRALSISTNKYVLLLTSIYGNSWHTLFNNNRLTTSILTGSSLAPPHYGNDVNYSYD